MIINNNLQRSMIENPLLPSQESITEHLLISFLYKKSINLIDKQIDQIKNSKDLLIIIYKIHQSISDILSEPDKATSLYLDYKEFVNIIKFEYNKSKQDDPLYYLDYSESPGEIAKKEQEEEKSNNNDIILRLKRKLKQTQEKNLLKEFNYLATISRLMKSNKELEQNSHMTLSQVNINSLSSINDNSNTIPTPKAALFFRGIKSKEQIEAIAPVSAYKNKVINSQFNTKLSCSIDTKSKQSFNKSSNVLSLSQRGREEVNLRKFKIYQKNRCSYVKKDFKLQTNIIQINNIINSYDKSYTPPNPFKLPIKAYYSTFSNLFK